ncbi:Gfo/Idh/MocA family oxidoreductase [Paenibacillus chondroitinus]|uniref:Gfo/Idh/MocA family oxidoreductase n=1 Tax=Paenibacillus chondroitinus TaxID=59842 RepID=A0ABU6DMJ0_9BACL|nr:MULTISPECIES: Gfo/Idh/MocA family oxidoreductase [Paenibacillus]MCY9661393.1 Gfo/Idh/MocA family oxidoreductase [Paenibacillus anseongense]MEB4798530.1 Gfo/Idh/MocA family oxidoreductase [Paenibacillus chondroitinus]
MIRFAVIGTNWITEEFIHAARETGEFALTAVYSRTEEKAAEFANKFEVAHRFTDLNAFAQSDTFDAVYIASPNSLHAEYAVHCMNHGKHVLCEKPAASNSAELSAMIEAARSNKVVFMEALKSTLMPNFKAIQENLHKLGPIRRYFAGYCQYSSRYDAYKQGTVLNAFNPIFSNGSLMDLGVYCIYPLAVLFGTPNRVQASGMLLESGVDGEGSLLLSYKDMDAVIMHSKIASSYLPAEIQGEHATMVIDKINQPEKVEIRYRDGSVENLTREQSARTMRYEAEEFIRLIQNGASESETNSHANSSIAMAIMDEARKQMGLVFPADRK